MPSFSTHIIAFQSIIYLLIVIFQTLSLTVYCQETIIKGRVTDYSNGEPIPFANVFYKGSSIGTVTDFDGYYTIVINPSYDSLHVSYIGFRTMSRYIGKETGHSINFMMNPSVVNLDELVFIAGENPAHDILRKTVQNKNRNDKRALKYYEYDTYNRVEIAIDNISDKLRKNKIMMEVMEKLDSIEVLNDDQGKRIIPVFLSESISKYYVKNDPEIRKENIIKSRVSGIGIEDGEFISQLIGSSFQEYNFYRNWMKIVEKEFISPIANGWKTYYEYELVDSLYVDGIFCYQLGIYPKNSEDLAFKGTMWITRSEYALKQIDVSVNKSSNLNFIESIKIQQELESTKEGAWLPEKTRVFIDISQLSKESAGLLAKFYTSNEQFVVNKPHEGKFYNRPVELAEDYQEKDPVFWENNRHDTLSADEKILFSMVDTLSNIPRIKTYSSIIKMFSTGYLRLGKIDIGPLLYSWSINDVEGNRLRFGMRTNEYFSRKFSLRGYLAYGFKDDRFKYGIVAGYIFNRKNWTELLYGHRYEIDQVGIPWDDLIENYFFLALTRFGKLNQPYLSSSDALRLNSDIGHGFSQQITFKREYFEALYNFAFYTDLNPASGEIQSYFTNTSLTYELRFARDETFLINGNQRISVGIRRAPAINLRYTYGFDGLFGGDFKYHKLGMDFEQKLKLGLLGVSHYKISAGIVINPLPYPLLYIPVGNETIFYTTAAYNMMNYFEFVNDTYVSFRYQHNFEGFLMNRIPLIRKLRWRLIGIANIIWGSLDQTNIDIIPETDLEGNPVDQFLSLNNTPYIELGYGIENIFKVVRLDFIHRLTYLDNPNVNRFGIKISFQLIL